MRNEKSFALPVEFTWKRAKAGYQWRDTPHGRLLYAVDALQPDWQNSFELYEMTYQPLEERTGLFHEFAQVSPSEEQVLLFANRFGLLGAGSDLQLESPHGPAAVYAESLKLWKREIEAFKLAIDAWDALAVGGRVLRELKTKLATPSLPLAMRRILHLDDEDPGMTALSLIQRFADDRLRDYVETRFRFRPSSPRLKVSLVPTNLLGALWLQFAAAVDRLKSFNRCNQCDAHFEVSRDPRTGKRSDALFCGSRCRVGHYRDRIEQARRMRSTGMTPERIAHKLGADVASVRAWVKSERKSPSIRRAGSIPKKPQSPRR